MILNPIKLVLIDPPSFINQCTLCSWHYLLSFKCFTISMLLMKEKMMQSDLRNSKNYGKSLIKAFYSNYDMTYCLVSMNYNQTFFNLFR